MNILHWLTIGLGAVLGCLAALHALLYKRNPSSALGWIAVCLMFLPIGALLYFLFGINRVRTRAKKLQKRSPFKIVGYERPENDDDYTESDIPVPRDLSRIVRVSQAVTRRPIVGGNQVQMLHNGEEAYPSMLEVIENAESSIFLATYIFETNHTGMRFIDALTRSAKRPSRVIDIHFRIEGPVVNQLEKVFLEDWTFCAGEQALVPSDFTVDAGNVICRTVIDGPNEDLDKLATILLGAISSAKHRISIMTPYFLPSREIISALQIAALRGVEVEVILPAKNNLPFVHWATRNMLWELLQKGVRVYYQPPPFVHSKLFIVDNHYAQIGSANFDPRSLRLNFELVLEIYDKETAGNLGEHVKKCRDRSEEISLEQIDTRPIAVRMRDAMAWLFSPYL